MEALTEMVNRSLTYLLGKGKYEIFNLCESNTITLKKMVETVETVRR